MRKIYISLSAMVLLFAGFNILISRPATVAKTNTVRFIHRGLVIGEFEKNANVRDNYEVRWYHKIEPKADHLGCLENTSEIHTIQYFNNCARQNRQRLCHVDGSRNVFKNGVKVGLITEDARELRFKPERNSNIKEFFWDKSDNKIKQLRPAKNSYKEFTLVQVLGDLGLVKPAVLGGVYCYFYEHFNLNY